MEQIRAFAKWAASFLKRSWAPLDYPLRYREQLPDPEFEARHWKLPRWNLQVINWWQMGGLGNTKAEAFADFEARFWRFAQEGTPLPRPGRGLPLTFASTAVIARHEAIAREFLRDILDVNYDECFISDESSLYDFCDSLAPDDAQALAHRIQAHYGIQSLDPERLVISEIVAAIASARGAA